MIFFISFLAAFICVGMIFLVIYIEKRPETQLRRRIQQFVAEAVEERTKKISQEKKFSRQAKEKTRFQKSKIYEAIISPVFDVLDSVLKKFAPVQIENVLEEKIFRAGMTGVWNFHRVISLWVFMVFVGTAMGFMVTTVVNLTFFQKAAIIFLGAVWGAAFPLARINSKIEKRKKIIRRTLPEFLDLLCVSVQAGLSFDGAISKISARMTGPLINEFKRMQNDVNLGMTREYAMTQLAKRCDLEEIYLFTSSVIQAEKLGTSMSRTLKIQADNMRDRHRQFIKAEAMRAPIKILFPMVLFIFPSVFVVLLFPAVLLFVRNLGG